MRERKEYVIVMKTICLRGAGIGVEQMPIADDMVGRRVRAAVEIALEKNKAMGMPSIAYDRIASVA